MFNFQVDAVTFQVGGRHHTVDAYDCKYSSNGISLMYVC